MNSSYWFFYDAYDFSEKGSVIFEHKMCRITSVIEDEIWLQENINSNREINYENFTSQSSEKTHFSIHHQKSFSPSPFHAYIGIPASASAAATSFWVEKILQAHQRTRAPSSTRDSIRTAACAVTWVHPTMRAPERGLSPAARFLKHFQLWRYCVSNFLGNSNMPNLTHWRRCVQKCVFLLFGSKFARVSFNIFSSENNLNRQKSISFQMRLLWKSYNQPIGLGGQKTLVKFSFSNFWCDLQNTYQTNVLLFESFVLSVFLIKLDLFFVIKSSRSIFQRNFKASTLLLGSAGTIGLREISHNDILCLLQLIIYLRDISAGISCSAISISRRPTWAYLIFLTQKSLNPEAEASRLSESYFSFGELSSSESLSE